MPGGIAANLLAGGIAEAGKKSITYRTFFDMLVICMANTNIGFLISIIQVHSKPVI